MKIYTVNFEDIVKVYMPYIDAVNSLEAEKDAHLLKIGVYKSKMQEIMNSSQTIILDEKLKKEKMEEFGNLQNDTARIDQEFRAHLTKSQNDVLTKIYAEISDIISDFSKKGEIDMIINSTEIVYHNKSLDITDTIIDLIKDKNLYSDLIKEKESV